MISLILLDIFVIELANLLQKLLYKVRFGYEVIQRLMPRHILKVVEDCKQRFLRFLVEVFFY